MRSEAEMKRDYKEVQFQQYRAGNWETIDGGVIVETPVSLTVNGQVWLTFMCTPNNLEALAAGFLFNEGVINNRDEIAELYLCESGDNIDVWLHRSVEQPVHWTRTSGCTGGMTSNDNQVESRKEIPFKRNGVTLLPHAFSQLVEQLFDSQQLYQRVGGVHTSVLSDGVSARVVAEDIGRHNSVDKIAGLCLLGNIRLRKKILLTTGRISSEMLQKSARIGAKVVVSRTSPSSLSIELAERLGITLVGYARRDRFNVYSHPDRILKTQDQESLYAPEPTRLQSG
jgi:FdhD protein